MSSQGTWSERRRLVLAGMGHAPQMVCSAERDHDLIIKLLVAEGVIEPAKGLHQITDAGKVLKTMHALQEKESGPWSLSEMRVYSAVKSLDMEACKAALGHLEVRGIVVAHNSKRGSKWDLTAK